MTESSVTRHKRNAKRTTFLRRWQPGYPKPEDHWSCIARLIAEDMLKSAVIEEKTFKHSPWAGADNPFRAKILMSTGRPHHYGHLLQVYKESLQPLTLYTSFHDLINVYSHRSGADNPRGQNFDVNRNLLSLQSFATSFKKISLKSDFIQFFSFYTCIYQGPLWLIFCSGQGMSQIKKTWAK